MATEPHAKPSFSQRRKLSLGLDLLARTFAVMAVVIMVIYLGAQYHERLFLSPHTRLKLSSRTVNVLKTVTNQVNVTLYYDKEDVLYPTLLSLLKEYRNINPRIQVTTVDYQWDAATAQKVKSKYKLGELSGKNEKNLVIFDCDGKLPKIVNGNALADFKLEPVPNEKEREFRRKLTQFNGEKLFTACLIQVTSPKPFRAYCLQGHGEHRMDSGDDVSGYMNFGFVLQQNNVLAEPLQLTGTNTVPMDCNLLVVAGPITPMDQGELDKISRYLDQGGRLLALFNSDVKGRQSGLEKVLFRWDVIVGDGEVTDQAHSIKGNDIAVAAFSEHPIVRSLLGMMLYLVAPRPVTSLPVKEGVADAPKVEVLAASEATAVLRGAPTSRPRRYHLAVAVEKGAPPGVVTERGSTRMIVVGDSYFLANGNIHLYANSDFARNAVNWLLDRPQLVEGIDPRPVTEFRILMTKTQQESVRWILLAALPGAVLALGGLVWVRRRK